MPEAVAESLVLVKKDFPNVVAACMPWIQSLSGKDVYYSVVEMNLAA